MVDKWFAASFDMKSNYLLRPKLIWMVYFLPILVEDVGLWIFLLYQYDCFLFDPWRLFSRSLKITLSYPDHSITIVSGNKICANTTNLEITK